MKDLSIPLSIKKLKYVIVGTGRCGTVFLAKLLSSVGIPCGHETIFQCDGMEFNLARLENSPELPSLSVSLVAKIASEEDEKEGKIWFGKNRQLEADASYMAAPFIDDPVLNDMSIIHIVRHPFQVINSFMTLGYFRKENLNIESSQNGWLYTPGDYHRFIHSFVPELDNDELTPIDRAAIYYVRWNKMIENKSANKKYFFQRVEDGYDKLAEFLGVSFTNAYDNRSVNKTDRIDKVTQLDDIPNENCRNELLNIGKRYGYL